MRLPLALAVGAIGLVIGLGGLDALLSHSARRSPVAADDAAVYARAEALVPKPAIPPPPPGATRLPPRTLTVRVPLSRAGGAPHPSFAHPVPQITPTTPAEAGWQATVDAEQAAYVRQLQQEIDQITQQQAAENAARMQTGSAWITAVLVPLIAAVAGFMTALAGLVSAMRAMGKPSGAA